MAELADIQDCLELGMVRFRTEAKFAAMQILSPMPKFKQDYEYVDYALHILGETIIINPFEVFPSFLEVSPLALVKSAAKSVDARNVGNAFYKEKKFGPAHHQYTRSISCAPYGSVELALAYGNRSAVLFELKLFKECIEDIEQAIASNYPKEKQVKLRVRQRNAEKLLPTQDKTPYHGPLPKIINKNSNIPSASDCIKIKKNKEFGRHIVATKEITTGELLLVEEPYANTVNLSYRFQFCSECLEVCYNLIPCKKCQLLYCSKVCREKAFVDYHRYECDLLRHFGYDSINWITVRMTLKGIKENKEHSQLFTHDNKIEIDILSYVVQVAKIFHVLKKYTDFFSEFDIDDNENVFKNICLENLKIMKTNAFKVVLDQSVLFHNIPIGDAIYKSTSFFNHACYHNVIVFFYGSTAVVKATRNIKRGEQCFINYGLNAISFLKEERRRHLEKGFNVVCKCQACIENWPIVKETLTVEEGRLVDEIILIGNIICSCTKIDNQYKNRLLQRTLEISEILESKAPFLAYKYTGEIFAKLLSDGNFIKPELLFVKVLPSVPGIQNQCLIL